MKVYQAINAVQREVAQVGISKEGKNKDQGYNFRAIDQVYNVMGPMLARNGLIILPRVLSRVCDERQTKSGSAIFNVTLEAEFDFISAEDGSKHTIKTYGEGMDSSDKATNKALSAAYKYALIQSFAIPVIGTEDPDHFHIETKAKKAISDEVVQAAKDAATLGTEAYKKWFIAQEETIRSALVSSGDHAENKKLAAEMVPA